MKALLDKISDSIKKEETINLVPILQDIKSKHDKKNITTEEYFKFIDLSSRKEFLTQLKTEKDHHYWAELIFKILQETNYSLLDMFKQRIEEHPNRNLFLNLSATKKESYTYQQIFNYTREIAAVFLSEKNKNARVAIFSANTVDSASTDLACLMYGIFDTPLNIHFSTEILVSIFNQLSINIVVTDTFERLKILREVQKQTKTKFKIFITQKYEENDTQILQQAAKEINYKEVNQILSQREKLQLNRVATTMFTSGSTGIPKGVSFSYYNLISKRFARHAALPKVGNETMLCFLPLFHTFGRFLEMMGAIYWHGTYAFVGNTSSDTLLKLFLEVNPTGFISVPIRWIQLYEKAMDELANIENETIRKEIIRKKVSGNQLRWGLSAAGYLNPKIFRFFHKYGIELSSGFGMTEATGGITMTPPGEYIDNSTGKALPGVYTRLKENGELEISGHYITRYLEEAGPGDIIPYPNESTEKNYWLPTGDIFKIDEKGHHQIIDRVKDIYKNNKGQTVAPRTVEQKFIGVPGVKHAFLVGDAKPYNVLLIVPEVQDAVFKSLSSDDQIRNYFHQIVETANNGVAPYERVVNFSILNRDFDADKKELTPKGSYNRKQIEKSFADTIKKLYKSDKISFAIDGIEVQIPRWFYRDLGILEDDISYENNYFTNQSNGKKLFFKKLNDDKCVIGNFQYSINGKKLNIGRLARQPKLWLGNSEFIRFSPVKEGWDLPLKEFSSNLCYPECSSANKNVNRIVAIPTIQESMLVFINDLIIDALFSSEEKQKQAIELLSDQLKESERRLAEVIRRRLEALACHSQHDIRTLAYRNLLINDPNPNYHQVLPIFIQSGKTFLDQESIEKIAFNNLGKSQLESLRKRLHAYRISLNWPVNGATQNQFEDILTLLFNFGKQNLKYYKSIRAEFAAWIMHRVDKHLSNLAKQYFTELYSVFDNKMRELRNNLPDNFWENRIIYEYGIPGAQEKRISKIITDSVFLEESIHLIFNQTTFTVDKIINEGIWITRLQSYSDFRHYRVTVNTVNNKHYDIHLVVTREIENATGGADLYWNAFLSDYPFEHPVLSSMGISNITLGVRSSQYLGGLRVWEKIRQMSEIHQWAGNTHPDAWRNLFIKAFAVIFRAWKISGKKIVPGAITPNNVMVPELEYKESAIIISLTGYRIYDGILSILTPIFRNFYQKSIALYPWSKNQLKYEWVFWAMMESLGKKETLYLLDEIENLLKEGKAPALQQINLSHIITEFKEKIQTEHYYPLKISGAIHQYNEWIKLNSNATKEAKEQTLYEHYDLFAIFDAEEIDRYYFYRHTYFGDANKHIRNAFDKLLQKMIHSTNHETIQLVELSDLQIKIEHPTDRRIFSKMVFPKIKHYQEIDVIKVIEKNKEQVIVQTTLLDKNNAKYIMREPREASEVGKLYQLFYEENYPKTISKMDQYFVVLDKYERVIGGISYKILDNNIVLLDGSAVTSPLQGKGIGSAMTNDFFTRMATKGVSTIKAHFLFGNYFLKHNFKVDKKWGALVKHLDEH